MLENIKLCQYDQPTPIQAYCIPAILQNHDVIAVAQTGHKIRTVLDRVLFFRSFDESLHLTAQRGIGSQLRIRGSNPAVLGSDRIK